MIEQMPKPRHFSRNRQHLANLLIFGFFDVSNAHNSSNKFLSPSCMPENLAHASQNGRFARSALKIYNQLISN